MTSSVLWGPEFLRGQTLQSKTRHAFWQCTHQTEIPICKSHVNLLNFSWKGRRCIWWNIRRESGCPVCRQQGCWDSWIKRLRWGIEYYWCMCSCVHIKLCSSSPISSPELRFHLLLPYTLYTQGHCLRVASSLRKIYAYTHVLYRRIKTEFTSLDLICSFQFWNPSRTYISIFHHDRTSLDRNRGCT